MDLQNQPKTIPWKCPDVAKACPDFKVAKTIKNHIPWGKAAVKARGTAVKGGHSPTACPSS